MPPLGRPSRPDSTAKPFSHADTPSLLATPSDHAALSTPPSEAADAPVDVPAAAPAEGPLAAAPLVYEFKLPEGLTVDEARITAATELFQQHRVDPAVAQELVSFHAQEMQRYADASTEAQNRAFLDVRKGWAEQVRSDPEMGGAGHNTAMQRIFRVRDMFVPVSDHKAFNEFLDATGAGDHPAFLRMLYRIGAKFDEPTVAPASQPIQPSKKERNRAAMYDHKDSIAARDRR